MNNKLLSAVLIAGITATGFAGLSSANDDTQVTTEKTIKEQGFKWAKFGNNGPRGMHAISDEDKTLIESMSDDEKKSYFESKKEEAKIEIELKESVIDNLLAGNTLTAEQEEVRAEMVTERAEQKEKKLEMKEKMEEMKAKMEEVKIIMEKKQAGEELTQEEEETLTSLKSQNKGKMRGSEKGEQMNKNERAEKGEKIDKETRGERGTQNQRGNK